MTSRKSHHAATSDPLYYNSFSPSRHHHHSRNFSYPNAQLHRSDWDPVVHGNRNTNTSPTAIRQVQHTREGESQQQERRTSVEPSPNFTGSSGFRHGNFTGGSDTVSPASKISASASSLPPHEAWMFLELSLPQDRQNSHSRLQKKPSRAWTVRFSVSSMVSSLIEQTTTEIPQPQPQPQPQPPHLPAAQQTQKSRTIHRKPVSSTPNQSPIDYIPPPPYSAHSLPASIPPKSPPRTHDDIRRKSQSPPTQPPLVPPVISLPVPDAHERSDTNMTNKLQQKRASSTPRVPPPDHAAPPPPPPIQHPHPSVPLTVDTRGPARLHKENNNAQPLTRRRSNSVGEALGSNQGPQGLQALGSHPPPRQGRLVSPDPPRGRSTSAQPPTNRLSVVGGGGGSRVVSNPVGYPRPTSSHQPTPNGSQSPPRKAERLRRTWMPGGRSRSNSQDMGHQSQAWVMAPDNSGAEYNTSLLVNAEKVPELWTENSNVYIYLYPRETGHGPSFKVPDSIMHSSFMFQEVIQAENTPTSGRARGRSFDGRHSLSVEDARGPRRFSPPTSPTQTGTETPHDVRLYIPAPFPSGNQLGPPGQAPPIDLERLVAIRNLFAFLTGQPLVGTKANPTPFAAFMRIARLLQEFGYSSADGSSFGPEVDLSFGFFIRQMSLGDVRHSREKTVESLVLGECMRSQELYNEAFAHAVGKYSAIVDIKSPLFEQISPTTRQRLDRAHLDLLNRQHNVNVRLEQFEFPSLFAGVASSTSMIEFKQVRFKQWRTAFLRMRNFVLGYYKTKFGNWPPKASSRKNPFSESGLNRLVLKELYSDMCALYDLLADRSSLTPRAIDQPQNEEKELKGNPMIVALRKILSEFDNSSPPVLPPIPFDAPTLPTMATILETYDSLPAKEQARVDKKIKDHEMTLILEKSYDFHTHMTYSQNPFLAEFKDFEKREARGKTSTELADHRVGFWLFLYVVIQSLPMLVIDAPGLNFTEGVEYFLCEPPMGNLPWMDDSQVRKMWYEVSGGQKIVELSADAVMFSVEAIYHRSHCWVAAKMWETALQQPSAPGQLLVPGPGPEQGLSPLEPPPAVFPGSEAVASPPAAGSSGAPSPQGGSPQFRGGNISPGRGPVRAANPTHRSSIAFGIEPISFNEPFDLPPPGVPGGPGDRSSRVVSHGPQHGRSSSLGPRPLSAHTGRSVSSSNLSALSNVHQAGSTSNLRHDGGGNMAGNGSGPLDVPGSGGSGATFDDILAGREKKPKKKKSFFFA